MKQSREFFSLAVVSPLINVNSNKPGMGGKSLYTTIPVVLLGLPVMTPFAISFSRISTNSSFAKSVVCLISSRFIGFDNREINRASRSSTIVFISSIRVSVTGIGITPILIEACAASHHNFSLIAYLSLSSRGSSYDLIRIFFPFQLVIFMDNSFAF